jgi:hypothetical protein
MTIIKGKSFMPSTSSNILRDLRVPIQQHGKTSATSSSDSKPGSIFTVLNKIYQVCEAFIKPRANLTPSLTPSPSLPRNRFSEAVRRIELSSFYKASISDEAPYGYYRNRIIIGEGVPINGSIYVGATPHEALVLDKKYGHLEHLILTLISRCSQIEEQNSAYEYEVFSRTVNLVRETLRYSEEGVQQILDKYHIKPDDKVTLDLFVQKKVGVARHQVLLVAFLLEQLRERNLISGHPTIENQISHEIPQERLLFTSSEGEIFRFDPTKGFGKTAIH